MVIPSLVKKTICIVAGGCCNVGSSFSFSRPRRNRRDPQQSETPLRIPLFHLLEYRMAHSQLLAWDTCRGPAEWHIPLPRAGRAV